MCGIAGIIRFDGAPASDAALRRMADVLAHRGPDGDGVYIAGSVGFSHRRLAIIDPTGGQQPLVDRETGMAINYNGEIYNYVEIRRNLTAPCQTDCDTEVVLRAWRQWGPSALERFRGMFAFAIHDLRERKVYLVRDRLGIKPLYYRLTPAGVTFASELNALVAQADKLEINSTALSLYLRYGYIPSPYSIYKNVRKLEPGHYLTIDIDSGKVQSSCYWRLDRSPRVVDEPRALEELDELLRDTMRLYVRSDVPFGAFLSGGVDSSLVAALMSETLGGGVRTFSIGFDDNQYSELPYAQEAADRLGTIHHREILSPLLGREFLEDIAGHFGEPFADSSALPTWLVSRVAAREVKMVLSGDGGDELFAGYNSYPAVARKQDNAALRPFYQAISRVAGPSRIGAFAAARSGTWRDEYNGQRDMFSDAERALLGDTQRAEIPSAPMGSLDPVTWCQQRDVATYLPDDILTKVDRMSMSQSLEVRVPLLDHKIVEFAFSLPLELRLRGENGGFTGKYLLKRAAERFFPRSFLDRPKWGFGIPLQKWLSGPLAPVVKDLLDRGGSALSMCLDGDEARRIVREFYAGRIERVGQVWGLLSFELWLSAAAAQPRVTT